MYTDTTYQDWLSSSDRLTLMQQVISRYKASPDFLRALEADDYFHARNRAVAKKVILRADAHRYIEKQAMDTRQSRREVALRILATYER